MLRSTKCWKTNSRTAAELAKTAADLILKFYKLDIIAEEKVGADKSTEPVTEADRAASRIIVEGLLRAFPDDAVLSEEEADDVSRRLSASRTWIVDPIDGTAGFIKKDGDFAIQVGLISQGEPVLGVIYAPALGYQQYAVKGQGSYVVRRDGVPVPLAVSDIADLSEATMAVSRNHRTERMSKVVERLGIKSEERRGSIGIKTGLIADRTCDLYINPSPQSKYWDTCAPQIILEEAGGRVTDLFGDRLRYDLADVKNHNGIVASNSLLHADVEQKLRPLLSSWGRVKVFPKDVAARNTSAK